MVFTHNKVLVLFVLSCSSAFTCSTKVTFYHSSVAKTLRFILKSHECDFGAQTVH